MLLQLCCISMRASVSESSMNDPCFNLATALIAFIRKLSGPAMGMTMLGVFDTISVHAQDVPQDSVLQPVVVTAIPFENRSELDVAQPVSVLKGDDLRRKREASLG